MDYPRLLIPTSMQEAFEILTSEGEGAHLLAGGTALSLMVQEQLLRPQALVSLAGIEALKGVESRRDLVRIGAMTTLGELAESDLVRERALALAEACASVGNVRVRNQATLGGNLCKADYASDPPTALLALDARVVVVGPDGRRELSIDELLLGFYTTSLEPTEVLTEILIPRPPAGSRMCYLKYSSRSSEDRPCVGAAAVGVFEGGVCRALNLAVGAATEVPQRIEAAEQMATGETLDDGLRQAIAGRYAEAIEPLDDLRGSAWYRRRMVKVFARRALEVIVPDGS